MKIGVIGSGISGLTTALLLSDEFEITIFEKNKYFGGHSNTVYIKDKNYDIPVDTGFIVYNEKNYPNFLKLINYLNVDTFNSDMSFCFSNKEIDLEYKGSLFGLIANYKNLLQKDYFIMLKDIIRFYMFGISYKKCSKYNETLLAYLDRCKFSKSFIDYHLIPMTSAIWSSNEIEIQKFPVNTMLNFFENHNLLNFFNRPQWKTIKGGSIKYVEKIISILRENKKNRLYTNTQIRTIKKNNRYLILKDSKNVDYKFDYVVFANHTDEAANILKNFDKEISKTLNDFRYQKNVTFLHKDKKLMPNNKLTWSSWNYLSSKKDRKSSLTYWMNKLQNLDTNEDIFVTLNPIKLPETNKTIKVNNYFHPIYDIKSNIVQKKISKTQGKNNIFFSGAWTGFGFHEDGVKSALKIAEILKIRSKI